MKELNYEELKNKIDYYIKNRVNLEKYINDSKQTRQILNTIFTYFDEDLEICDFKIIELVNFSILKYVTLNREKNKEIDNIVLVKDNKPIFRIEHYRKNNNETIYSEDTYSVYEEATPYLNSKISIKALKSSDISTSTVNILDKIDSKIRQYYRKEYTFYQNGDRVISLRTSNNMYLEEENGFKNRLETSTKLINHISNKINNQIENIILEDNVKQYQIKRKK